MLDLDVICLQEVATTDLCISGYELFANIDERRRGTAVLVRNGINVSNVRKSIDSRLICTTIANTVTVINVYAPSGTNNRAAREDFYNRIVPQYMLSSSRYVLLAGDFNAVVNPNDTTGGSNVSPNLKRLIQAENLTDTWRHFNNQVDFTFVRAQSMSRIDTIYVNQPVIDRVRFCRIQVKSFSDHKAVVMRVVLPFASEPIPRPPWKLNNCLLTPANLEELQGKWAYWKRMRPNYRTGTDWWVSFVKSKLVSFFKWKQNQFYNSHNNTMGFYYSCLQRAYAANVDRENTAEINRIKGAMLAKQRKLNESLKKTSLRHLPDEDTSLFQLHDQRRRQAYSRIGNLLVDGQVLQDSYVI